MYRFSALSTQWLNPDPQAAKARATRTNSRGITKLARDRPSHYMIFRDFTAS